jgi:hypothetical protein
MKFKKKRAQLSFFLFISSDSVSLSPLQLEESCKGQRAGTAREISQFVPLKKWEKNSSLP